MTANGVARIYRHIFTYRILVILPWEALSDYDPYPMEFKYWLWQRDRAMAKLVELHMLGYDVDMKVRHV